MLAWIIYAVVAFFVALILTFVYTAVRPLPTRADTNPAKSLIVMYILTVGGPFAYVEANTHRLGPKVEHQIKEAWEDAPIDGKIQYYRVMWSWKDRASAIAVGEEPTKWGGTDRPVLQVNLARVNDTWKLTDSKVIISEKLDKDSFIFPPYH